MSRFKAHGFKQCLVPAPWAFSLLKQPHESFHGSNQNRTTGGPAVRSDPHDGPRRTFGYAGQAKPEQPGTRTASRSGLTRWTYGHAGSTGPFRSCCHGVPPNRTQRTQLRWVLLGPLGSVGSVGGCHGGFRSSGSRYLGCSGDPTSLDATHEMG